MVSGAAPARDDDGVIYEPARSQAGPSKAAGGQSLAAGDGRALGH